MNTVYTYADPRQKNLWAWWKSINGKLNFYTSDPLHFVTRWSVEYTEWEDQRSAYSARDSNFDNYDDLVNAGWHNLSLNIGGMDKSRVVVSKMTPGVYHPRIWRGAFDDYLSNGYSPIDARATYGSTYIQSIVAAESLFQYLKDIFTHIEPALSNMKAYGHKIRECIILACTEVEAAWRGVLKENLPSKKERYSTSDYFILKEAMRLGDWIIGLGDYPELGNFCPFSDWSDSAPTASLPWYDAYNATKHDREESFSVGTFKMLIEAMAAVHIMQVVQWGPETFSVMHANRKSPFVLKHYPHYGSDRVYLPSLTAEEPMTPVPYFS